MKTVTIDASAATSWIFPRQATASADVFLAGSADRRFTAPGVFAWEIGNLIATRSRRASLEPGQWVERLEGLGIEIGSSPSGETVLGFIDAAMKHDLTLFDTAYLLHALGHGGGLASRDAQLLKAATTAGVEVFDLRD